MNIFSAMKNRKASPPAYRPEQLTLRIKHRHFLDNLMARGVPQAQMPVTAPLCGELLLSYAFEQPDQFVMATPGLLDAAGIAREELEPLALKNFKGRFSAQLLRLGARPELMCVRTGEDLEAVMLVFAGFWSGHVQPQVQGHLVVCAPRRDVLLIADTAVPGAVDALREHAAEVFGSVNDAHALSLQLMQWTADGWTLFNDQPRHTP